MTDEGESFLTRWSRRKREAAMKPAREAEEGETRADPQQVSDAPSARVENNNELERAADFDPNSLPGIEEISAETDISGFLNQGVPADLSRAALRRAWVTDPAIRDFVGLAENAQDFNAPNEIAGFGPLPAAQVAQLLEQVFPAPRSGEQDMPEALQSHADAHKAIANSQASTTTPLDPFCNDDAASSTSAGESDAASRHQDDESSANDPVDGPTRDGALQTSVAGPPTPSRRKGSALPK